VPQPIPINDVRALWLLICCMLLLGGWRARARPQGLSDRCGSPAASARDPHRFSSTKQ
jgi:hypothetical protein